MFVYIEESVVPAKKLKIKCAIFCTQVFPAKKDLSLYSTKKDEGKAHK